jgi:hypothetical protein
MQGKLFGIVKVLFADNNSYVGEVSNYLPNGNGNMTFNNGNVFDGVWANGNPSLGKMTFKNGQVYSGQWDANTFQGEGTLTYADGLRYKGMWSKGAIAGDGVFTMADGTTVEGSWELSERRGEVARSVGPTLNIVYKNRDVFRGSSKKIVGQGSLTYADSSVDQG